MSAPLPVSDFTTPAYGDRSLADVLPAVAAALGSPLPDRESGLWVLPEAPAYVVLLIDGLGAELLRHHAAAAPFLSGLQQGAADGTAGVPSTTATSLTSLGTGQTPGGHGVVGYTSRIPGTTELLNALAWPRDVDPRQWQPHPTVFATLATQGVTTSVVNRRDFADSGLTSVSQRGAHFVGANGSWERLDAVLDAVETTPSLTYVYESDLDYTGHRFGCESPEWLAKLTQIDGEAAQLREELPSSVRLLIVADHGMVDSPAEARLDIDAHPSLRDGVVLVGGEARFRHVYTRTGADADVLAAWRGVLGERAVVLGRDEAIEAGWFGEVNDLVRPRLGDVVAAARGNHTLISSVDFAYESQLVGFHGSLTPVELSIPLLIS